MRAIGGRGVAPGEFISPRGVAAVGSRLVVAEHSRLQVLSRAGAPLQLVELAFAQQPSAVCYLAEQRLVLVADGPRKACHAFAVRDERKLDV